MGEKMALININYESKALGMPVMINIIIPQGRGNYKTLYLLHGMGGDEARDMYGKYSVMAQDIITGAGNVLKRIEEW